MQTTFNKDFALLLLRLVAGGMMIVRHGWPKLERLLAEGPVQFGDPIGLGPEISLLLAVFAELICALLLMAGFYTRLAAWPLIITMAVAAFVVHIDDPFSKMEFPILYLLIFLTLALVGPGWYSLDARLRNRP